MSIPSASPVWLSGKPLGERVGDQPRGLTASLSEPKSTLGSTHTLGALCPTRGAWSRGALPPGSHKYLARGRAGRPAACGNKMMSLTSGPRSLRPHRASPSAGPPVVSAPQQGGRAALSAVPMPLPSFTPSAVSPVRPGLSSLASGGPLAGRSSLPASSGFGRPPSARR